MLSYRKLAMRVPGRPLHTGGNDSPRPASQRAAAFILTAAMLTTLAAPAFADTWCIENGNITVKAGDTEGTNKVSQGSIIDREDTNTIITNSDKDTASSNTVTIDAGNDKVEVTLDNVNIKAGSGSALTSKGDVTLTLKGDNHLTGGISDTGNYGRNGIASTGSLTITGGENGSLTAQGGSGADGGHGGHGIYSNGSLTSRHFYFRFTWREIDSLDSPFRTFRFAFTARLTLSRINVCQIIFQRNGFERTHFHTLSTTNTTSLASFVGNSSLILVHTHHHYAAVVLSFRTNFNDLTRTSFAASPTSCTFFFVHFRKTGFRIHVNSIKLTRFHTITTTQTTECTTRLTT